MKFRIEPHGEHLLAELQDRETAAEMREFLLAVKKACLEHACPRVLLSVRASRPVFKLEEYGLSGGRQGYANELITPACRIALVGDTSELNHAHDYVELVARQRQINVRAFKDLASAQQWLLDPQADAILQAAAPRRARRSR
jgi:hypothetical protein